MANLDPLRARGRIRELVEAAKPCDCHRKLEPGFNRWWDSVTVSVEAEQ